jgi:hypothetical protein
MVTRVLENVAENHRADMRVRPPLRKDAIN